MRAFIYTRYSSDNQTSRLFASAALPEEFRLGIFNERYGSRLF